MAFDFNFLSNTGGTSPAPILYTYSTTDSKATVSASGYFNSGFTKLKINDLITVVNDTEVFTLRFLTISATGTTTITTETETTMTDYLTEVALGNVEGVSIIRALGERETMAVTASGEDIWRGNELTSPVPAS
ncbi:MAG: hypothetical protein GY829_12495, partial [Gammaproteobacteria bacterium]|nr:hypothetical protein [Gammaproteobacteria bacterium]